MSNITYIWANSNRLQQEKVYLKTQSSGEDKTNILSATLWTFRRVGHGVGQEKAVSQNGNLRKAKVLEIRRFRGLLVRREGFEPPAFWSVGCLKGKSESFRLRFVLFAIIRSAGFPLFPSSPARFFRILGQNWVNDDFAAAQT